MEKKDVKRFNELVDKVLDYDNRDKLTQTMAYFFGCLNCALEDEFDITAEDLISWLDRAIEFVHDQKR